MYWETRAIILEIGQDSEAVEYTIGLSEPALRMDVTECQRNCEVDNLTGPEP
jgi:hypothetical protein